MNGSNRWILNILNVFFKMVETVLMPSLVNLELLLTYGLQSDKYKKEPLGSHINAHNYFTWSLSINTIGP